MSTDGSATVRLWYFGIAVIVVGAVMFILGSMGRRIGGRRDYWRGADRSCRSVRGGGRRLS
ncbi:MAG TPA: DUF6131 family protein [Pseudonocardiaceae bacterium]